MQCLPVVCLSLILLTFGCGPGTSDSSLGERGKVAFSYQRSCFFGCPLEQPLLLGTREDISVSGPASADGVTVGDADAELASFVLSRTCYCQEGQDQDGRLEIAEDAHCNAPRKKVCEARVQVDALAAGDARLELFDREGALLDRTTVHVREAQRARFFDERSSLVEALELSPGQKRQLDLRLYDDQGQRLLAPEGVRWRTGDEDLARVSAWLIGSGSELSAGLSVSVEALRAGQTEVSIEVPGLETSIPLEVR